MKRILDRLLATGQSESGATKKAGLSADTIRNMRRRIAAGERDVSFTSKTINALAPILETTPGWLLTGVGDDPEATPDMVKIAGKAGAGPDGSVLFATGDGYFGLVPAPKDATPTTLALEVQGDSMRGMAEDGWIIFYDDKQPPNEDHMGEPCVCFLEDDRVLIKTPYPGRAPGLFDLESVNAPTMRDVAVRYFAFITDIKPRRSARKHIRRNPDAQIEEVTTTGKRLTG